MLYSYNVKDVNFSHFNVNISQVSASVESYHELSVPIPDEVPYSSSAPPSSHLPRTPTGSKPRTARGGLHFPRMSATVMQDDHVLVHENFADAKTVESSWTWQIISRIAGYV